MILVIDEGCESVTITSDYFDAENQSVSLGVTINCGTEYTVAVEVEATEIVVDPEALGLDLDALEDGVYYFELTITQEDGTKVVEGECRFINCGTTCLMLESFTDAAAGDKDALVRALAFHALVASDGCTSCACSDLCDLYTATNLVNCDSNVSSCGCS